VAFDLNDLKVLGSDILVLEDLFNNPDGSIVKYAVSDSGTLVYIPGIVSEVIENTLVWVTRDGKEEPLGTPVGRYYMPKISPDGKSVALCVAGENTDVKVLDLERNSFMRLTLDESMDMVPIWTPDGKRIVYHSSGKKMGVYWKNADGTGQRELLISEPDRALYPYSWSSDGKTLVMGETQDAVTKYDISILPMEGERTRKPLLQEDYLEMMPQISPDGKWIAYCSNESGENEIFVRPFPDVDKGKHQVSTTGGFAPRWAPDGNELYYMNVIENEVVVIVAKVETEPAFKLSSPEPLFQGAYGGPSCPWDVHPNGKKFLMIKNLSSTSPESTAADRPKIIVVKNWFEELKEQVPVD
jgi:Tol biopolymer transport system component